jgi:hypothetical protein
MIVDRTMQMCVQLANPALIFIYNLVLLLFGTAIGIHWGRNPGMAVWVAICAALLMVIHDLLEGLIWFGIAAKWAQMVKQSSASSVPSKPAEGSRREPDI